MGMFDDIRVHIPLPIGDEKTEFQTKSMNCSLENYEIRDDGSLWIRPMGTDWQQSSEWEPTKYTGEISFYTTGVAEVIDADNPTGWLQYSAYFVNGKMAILNRLHNRWLSEPVWNNPQNLAQS